MTEINSTLNKLSMSASNEASGLLAINDDCLLQHSPHEVVALLSARECQADYVYFRRFADGRPSIPQVYLYDNTDDHLSQQTIAGLHRKVWNRGEAPLIYIIRPTVVDILCCARTPDFLSKSGKLQFSPVETIQLIADSQEALDRFSGKSFDTGLFWADPRNATLIDKNKAAHQSLVQAVKEFDARISTGSLPSDVGRRLLILCILVKYLEDRKVFPSDFFATFLAGAKCFFDVLQDPESTISLFGSLKNRFNGDVFVLAEFEKESLTTENLLEFSFFIQARTLKDQIHFWKLYTFEDIPVEIISYIYQNFVKGSDAVYTPHFLVDLLLDECMPLRSIEDDFKVLDPSCGSGVFLVGAYKRLINAWRLRNNWQSPDLGILKKLLKQNIFGIDLDATAVELTSFSLCLALCDALQPKVIWNELQFERLKSTNIHKDDFFAIAVQPNYDLIIGNPPFEEKLTTLDAVRVNNSHKKLRGDLPQAQMAYLFLEHAFTFAKPNARVCLIIPHGILYNYGTQNFREHIFNTWHVEEVLDFISIRGLFASADVKVCSLLFKNQVPDYNRPVVHITFRRTKNTHEQLNFEIDHYDVHSTPRVFANSERLIWRANLLGGARVFALIRRLDGLRTLKQFADDKGWDFGEGFIAGEKDANDSAEWITGKTHLPTAAFNSRGIDESKITIYHGDKFKSCYTPLRFSPPMILLKANESMPIALWTKSKLTYKARIMGITGGPAEELQGVFKTIKRNLNNYRFFLALRGSQAMTGKSTVPNSKDFYNLPYPEDPKELELSRVEQIISNDCVNYMSEFIRKGDTSKLFRVSPSDTELLSFGRTFCDVLGSIYDTIQPSQPINMSGLICYPFYFGNQPIINLDNHSELEQSLNLIMQRQHHKTLYISRIIRLYQENVVFIIKPNLLRYWIQSVALCDADDIFAELRQQGF